MALPTLPAQGQNPWFTERNNWDLAVKDELEGRLSDAGIAVLVSNSARTYLENLEGSVRVDDYPGANDTIRIQAAIDDAVTRGLGTVIFDARDYFLVGTVNIPPVSGLNLIGSAGKTWFKLLPGASLSNAFLISGAASTTIHENLTFAGLSFHGGMSNIAELGDTRARGQGGSEPVAGSPVVEFSYRLYSAILARGDLAQFWNSAGDQPNPYGEVRNIRVVDCNFVGTPGLPVFFQGVRGYCELIQSYLTRCLDPGWVFCEYGRFSDNHSRYSMDNGVSLSRGCITAIASNNYVYKPWTAGIWVSGWFAQSAPAAPALGLKPAGGPVRATVTGNIVEWSGACGIEITDSSAEANITVTGNNIVNTIPVNPWSTLAGVAIEAGAAPGVVPSALTITGNNITNARRGGILAPGFRATNISNNTLRNFSTRYYEDGTTERTGNFQRFGINSGTDTPFASPNTVVIVGNIFSNTTGVQQSVTNPIYWPGSSGRMIQNNIAYNTINPVITANNT